MRENCGSMCRASDITGSKFQPTNRSLELPSRFKQRVPGESSRLGLGHLAVSPCHGTVSGDELSRRYSDRLAKSDPCEALTIVPVSIKNQL